MQCRNKEREEKQQFHSSLFPHHGKERKQNNLSFYITRRTLRKVYDFLLFHPHKMPE